MKFNRMIALAAISLSFLVGTASAEGDKAAKQAELVTATSNSLEKFYEAEPKLKSAVAKAPGYAVFTTYGLSFFVGGSGGKGLVHDNKSGKNTYMEMAQASVGVQVGASESDTLIIFQTAKAMNQFVSKGWQFGGGGGAGAGAGGKTVGGQSGGNSGNSIANAKYYTLNKNGLQIGGAASGTKFWPDKDLN